MRCVHFSNFRSRWGNGSYQVVKTTGNNIGGVEYDKAIALEFN